MPEVVIAYSVRHQNAVPSNELVLQPKKPPKLDANWLYLPYELWLSILVDYGISGKDLVNLEYTCKWFSNCWGGKLSDQNLFELPANAMSRTRTRTGGFLRHAFLAITQ